MDSSTVSRLRLFQLISPSLPTGAFTYSQALEWAVECGWVRDKTSLIDWLESLLYSAIRELEIPLLKRLYIACEEADLERFSHWSQYSVACRETQELRQEEINRGRAMARFLGSIDTSFDSSWLQCAGSSQVAGFALAAHQWGIELFDAALGYAWGWLENMVLAAVKIVPLGQTEGQQALIHLADFTATVTRDGLQVKDDNLGGSCPAFAIGSCLHETQYTRLFRS